MHQKCTKYDVTTNSSGHLNWNGHSNRTGRLNGTRYLNWTGCLNWTDHWNWIDHLNWTDHLNQTGHINWTGHLNFSGHLNLTNHLNQIGQPNWTGYLNWTDHWLNIITWTKLVTYTELVIAVCSLYYVFSRVTVGNGLSNGCRHHHSLTMEKDFAGLLENDIDEKSDAGDGENIELSKQKPSLLKALTNTFVGFYSLAGVLLLMYDLVAFVNPIVLQWV